MLSGEAACLTPQFLGFSGRIGSDVPEKPSIEQLCPPAPKMQSLDHY
jgi:hypothetical protein